MFKFCWYWSVSTWSLRFRSCDFVVMFDLGPLAVRLYA